MDLVYQYAAELDAQKRENREVVDEKEDDDHEEKLKNGYYLKRVTDPNRFCQFPNSKVSFLEYCHSTFSKVSNERVNECNNMMC